MENKLISLCPPMVIGNERHYFYIQNYKNKKGTDLCRKITLKKKLPYGYKNIVVDKIYTLQDLTYSI